MYYKLNKNMFNFIKELNDKKNDDDFFEEYLIHFSSYVFSNWFFYDYTLNKDNEKKSYKAYLLNYIKDNYSKDSLCLSELVEGEDLSQRRFINNLIKSELKSFSPVFDFIVINEDTFLKIKTKSSILLKWLELEFFKDNKKEFINDKDHEIFNFVLDWNLQYRDEVREITINQILEKDLTSDIYETIYDNSIDNLLTIEEKQSRTEYKKGVSRINDDIKLRNKLLKEIELEKYKHIYSKKERSVMSIILNSFE